MDREKVMSWLEGLAEPDWRECYSDSEVQETARQALDLIDELLKEQEKKQINLHKKHVITWKRDEEFTMRKLYEAVCETLMDEGELVITRIDDHEKVDFTFYVTHEVT